MKKIIIVFLIGFMSLVLKAQKVEGTVYGRIPLYFIANKGQVNLQAQFYAKASKYTLWMTKNGMVFDSKHTPSFGHVSQEGISKYFRDVSRLVFINANKNPAIIPVDISNHRVNVFAGSDKNNWKTDIPTSKTVMYKNLYRNIDLKVYGIEKQVEYDWHIKPGGNPQEIRFKYHGVKKILIDKEGNLRIETTFAKWIHKKPQGYQEICREQPAAQNQTSETKLVAIEVKFKKIGKNIYGFEVGEYDKRYELIIDPVVLAYSIYLGETYDNYGEAIAVDNNGSAYITGYTNSPDFPTQNPFQIYQGTSDVFVTKISPSGDSLEYSTYLGGINGDYGSAIAVDSGGNAYISGSTSSQDFPTKNPFQENFHGVFYSYSTDVFVAKLSPSGNALVYSTYLGGSNSEVGQDIAIDSSGNAYVTGYTLSPDFPVENPFQESLDIDESNRSGSGGQDAFITKLSTSGNALVYSTYLGGSDRDIGWGIAVDSCGNAFVTGFTFSTDFPTMNPFQMSQGASDAFVTKLSPFGDSLIYSTYLGGSNTDTGYDIAVDSSGNAFVTGYTESIDFPTENPFQGNLHLEEDEYGTDVFITKLSPTGNEIGYSTYLGGNDIDVGRGIAVDSNGNAYISGFTSSSDFPTRNAFQENLMIDELGGISQDVFITKLSPSGDALDYSTYFGGEDWETGSGIALDSFENAYVIASKGDFDFEDVYVLAAKIGNFFLNLQISRQEERAWLIRIQYAEILLTVENPGDIPVSNYVIYRKEANETNQYQAIKDIPAPEVQGGTYTYNDLLPQGDIAYTYKIEILDANGKVIGVSYEQTI
jgi:hypothetical protein